MREEDGSKNLLWRREISCCCSMWVSGPETADLFGRSCSRCCNPIIWRLPILIWAVATIIWSLMTFWGPIYMWLLYMTHWGLILIALQSLLGTIVAIAALRGRLHDTNNRLPFYVKIYWILYNIAIPVACLVTVFYWALLQGFLYGTLLPVMSPRNLNTRLSNTTSSALTTTSSSIITTTSSSAITTTEGPGRVGYSGIPETTTNTTTNTNIMLYTNTTAEGETLRMREDFNNYSTDFTRSYLNESTSTEDNLFKIFSYMSNILKGTQSEIPSRTSTEVTNVLLPPSEELLNVITLAPAIDINAKIRKKRSVIDYIHDEIEIISARQMKVSRDPMLDLSVHAINSAVMLLELVLSLNPSRLIHVYQPILFACVYLIFGVVYYEAGGVDPWGNHWIYPVIDWSKPNQAMVVVTVTGIYLGIMHVLIVIVASARDKINKLMCDTEGSITIGDCA